MALHPEIKIEPLEQKWEKGRCSLCREPCEPEGYLHSQCAITRYDYIDAQRKKFWADWKEQQDKRIKEKS